MAKILIVEDDPLSALDLQNEVERLGYEVVGMVESADEALIASEESRPDLALLDINIAGSMDGIQTARLLHHAYRVPVIFISSASDDLTVARAAKLPLYGYLVKPFKCNELKASMQLALQKSASDLAREFAHETMEATVGSLPEGVLTVTLDHQVKFMNRAAEQMTGFNLFQAKGKKLFDVLNVIDSRHRALPDLNNAQGAMPMEEFGCSLSRDGKPWLLVDVAVTPLTDFGGARTGFVVTLRNAAERLRAQAVEEALDEVHSFDLAPMPMIQVDGDGRIMRVNAAMLHQSGTHESVMIGRSLTALSMDRDPQIAQVLFQKLLRADAIAPNVNASKMH
jgi:PAS domain S-box-containing protein